MSAKLTKKAQALANPAAQPLKTSHVKGVEVHEKAKLVAKEWVDQDDVPLGLHPSVAATFASLAAEDAEMIKRFEQNRITRQRMVFEITRFYKLNVHDTKPVLYSPDFMIMVVPQPMKLKEKNMEIPQVVKENEENS